MRRLPPDPMTLFFCENIEDEFKSDPAVIMADALRKFLRVNMLNGFTIDLFTIYGLNLLVRIISFILNTIISLLIIWVIFN